LYWEKKVKMGAAIPTRTADGITITANAATASLVERMPKFLRPDILPVVGAKRKRSAG
jgi:hypothetical protein